MKDIAAVRQEGSDMFDAITVPILNDVDPENREFARAMYIEGYLAGWANGGMATLEGLQ